MSGIHLDRPQQLKMYSLYLQGVTIHVLAKRFGINHRTVSRTIKALKESRKP